MVYEKLESKKHPELIVEYGWGSTSDINYSLSVNSIATGEVYDKGDIVSVQAGGKVGFVTDKTDKGQMGLIIKDIVEVGQVTILLNNIGISIPSKGIVGTPAVGSELIANTSQVPTERGFLKVAEAGDAGAQVLGKILTIDNTGICRVAMSFIGTPVVRGA